MFPEGRILDFLLVGVIALIVVGPKDLPVLMRRVGEFVGKMRAMAAEFRASFDEMARQSELEELRKEVEAIRGGQTIQGAARGALGLGADSAAGQVFGDIEADLASNAGHLAPPTGYQYPSSFEPAVAASPEAADAPQQPEAPPLAPPDMSSLEQPMREPPAPEPPIGTPQAPAPAKASP